MYSKPFFLTIFGLILLSQKGSSQSDFFTQDFDFQKINTRSFTVNVGSNNQQKHLWSSLATCVSLADLAKNGNWNESRVIGNVPNNIKLRATKLSYTPFDVEWGGDEFKLRMIFIRPDDQVVRPCVLLSPGGRADFNNWYNYLALGVADYVSRGYAVAFYENFNNKYVMDAVSATPNSATNLPVTNDPELPFYAAYQFALAAAHCTSWHAAQWRIHTNLFASGNSAGGFSSYALALADENNFTNPVFEALGNTTHKVAPEYLNAPFQIIGLGIIGSGLFNDNAKMGPLVDESDSSIPTAVIWHGKNDNQISIMCCPNTPCTESNGLEICGGSRVADMLCEAGLNTDLWVNCQGDHLGYKSLLTASQITNNPTLAIISGPLLREFQQMMSIQQTICHRFSQSWNMQVEEGCSINYVQPKNYPNPLGSNWLLVPSNACEENSLSHETEQFYRTRTSVAITCTIAPNPAHQHLNLSFNQPIPDDYRCILYHSSGKIVFDQKIVAGSELFEVKVSHLEEGSYFLQIIDRLQIAFCKQIAVIK